MCSWEHRQALDAFHKGLMELDIAYQGDHFSAKKAVISLLVSLEWVTQQSWPQLWEEIHQALSEAYSLQS